MPAEIGSVSLKLPAFEGPLDLLLHLIRVSEIDIYDIPIVEITRQYDDYLALMNELDLQLAGEYILMAATLVHIKSRMLLPQPPAGAGEEEDPRSDLVRRLVEYEKFKLAAESLRSFEEARWDVYHRPGDPLAEFSGESLLSVSLFDLVTAFKRVLDTFGAAQAVEIGTEEFSITDKQEWILSSLDGDTPRVFQDLIRGLSCRAEMIVAFLALLELIRLRRLQAVQAGPGGDILLVRAGEGAERKDGDDA